MDRGGLEEVIIQKLEASIKDISTLIVREDKAACNGSYVIVVVAESFQGVGGPLDRARLVNGLLAEEIKKMHAVTVKCWTAAQWEKNRSQFE